LSEVLRNHAQTAGPVSGQTHQIQPQQVDVKATNFQKPTSMDNQASRAALTAPKQTQMVTRK